MLFFIIKFHRVCTTCKNTKTVPHQPHRHPLHIPQHQYPPAPTSATTSSSPTPGTVPATATTKTTAHQDAPVSLFNAHWMLHPSKNFTGSAADAGQHAVEARLGAPLSWALKEIWPKEGILCAVEVGFRKKSVHEKGIFHGRNVFRCLFIHKRMSLCGQMLVSERELT